MTDASLGLPRRHTVLRSFAGHLEAPPATVYPRLVAALTPAAAGARGSAGAVGSADAVRALAAVRPGAVPVRIVTDQARHVVVVQGDWWYRGEYRVLAENDGSLVQYEIINVAQVAAWAGTLTARTALKAAPRAFQALLTAVGGPLAH